MCSFHKDMHTADLGQDAFADAVFAYNVRNSVAMQVIWTVDTDNTGDLNWLDDVLLPSEPEHYRRIKIPGD